MKYKDIELENVLPLMIGYNPIIESQYAGVPNMSSIYSKLIQEAGRICERYSSDILVDIDTVNNMLENWKGELSFYSNKEDIESKYKSFVFGFRKNGVDHWAFIKSRFSNGDYKEYYKFYRLDISCESGYIYATLYEADIH